MPDTTTETDAPVADASTAPAAETQTTASAPAAADETISPEEARKLRSEAKNLRQRAKDAEEKAQALEAEKADAARAKLSEDERLKADLAAVTAERDTAKAEAERVAGELAAERAAARVEKAAARLGFADPSDAILYVGDVPEGEADLEKRLKAVLEAKPHLAGKPAVRGLTPSPVAVADRPMTDEQRRANSYRPRSL